MLSVEKQNLFKWKHYQPDIILLTIKWCLAQPQFSGFNRMVEIHFVHKPYFIKWAL